MKSKDEEPTVKEILIMGAFAIILALVLYAFCVYITAVIWKAVTC